MKEPTEMEARAKYHACMLRGGHDNEEFIDPNSGGFTRCKSCGHEVDREDPDGDLG